MGEVVQISEFGKILIFLITGIIMVCAALASSKIIAPSNPTPQKLTSYECGEEPTGSAWLPFNSRFYVIALIFLLFDVEMMFVFPWATVFADKNITAVDHRWPVLSMVEMFIFMAILILGLAYVWVKGDLEWIKPNPVLPTVDVNIPAGMYNALNKKQLAFTIKPFALQQKDATPSEQTLAAAPTSAITTEVKKPMFKPAFKKPGN